MFLSFSKSSKNKLEILSMPNLNVSERIWKEVPKKKFPRKASFRTFLPLNCPNFRLKQYKKP